MIDELSLRQKITNEINSELVKELKELTIKSCYNTGYVKMLNIKIPLKRVKGLITLNFNYVVCNEIDKLISKKIEAYKKKKYRNDKVDKVEYSKIIIGELNDFFNDNMYIYVKNSGVVGCKLYPIYYRNTLIGKEKTTQYKYPSIVPMYHILDDNGINSIIVIGDKEYRRDDLNFLYGLYYNKHVLSPHDKIDMSKIDFEGFYHIDQKNNGNFELKTKSCNDDELRTIAELKDKQYKENSNKQYEQDIKAINNHIPSFLRHLEKDIMRYDTK